MREDACVDDTLSNNISTLTRVYANISQDVHDGVVHLIKGMPCVERGRMHIDYISAPSGTWHGLSNLMVGCSMLVPSADLSVLLLLLLMLSRSDLYVQHQRMHSDVR